MVAPVQFSPRLARDRCLCLAAASRGHVKGAVMATASRDQAGDALCSANVFRPAGSPLIWQNPKSTLRRARHRPDPASTLRQPCPSRHSRFSRHSREGGNPVFPSPWIPAFAGMTTVTKEALGVSGVAASRRRPQAGGQPRSYSLQVPGRTKLRTQRYPDFKYPQP